MRTRNNSLAVRLALVGALAVTPVGMATATSSGPEATPAPTDTHQAWMIPLPGWWSGKVYCMTFNAPECPNYQPEGPIA